MRSPAWRGAGPSWPAGGESGARGSSALPASRAVTAPTLYYLVWLLAGLALIALASTRLVRRLVRREGSRACACALADALSRYAAWLAVQRGHLMLEIDRVVADMALEEARELQARCFPQLAGALQGILATDRALAQWFRQQHALRHRDPEAWLDSQADPVGRGLLRAQDEALDLVRRCLPGAQGVS